MYLTRELALSMESCIKQTHIEMARSHPLGKILDLGEGAACFAGFSSFFSQVVAWGFNLTKKQFNQQTHAIEHFYHALNHPHIDIELCPLVGNDLPMALCKRGYELTELNNVSFIDLVEHNVNSSPNSFEIRSIEASEILDWSHKVALGFGYLEAQEQFAHYARLKGVTAFAVYNDGQIIAGATIAIHNNIADLGVTSTIPSYRGKGLQKLLLNHRLIYAQKRRIPLAIVTTEPGSISDLNIQKVGFRCGYTRLKFTKSL